MKKILWIFVVFAAISCNKDAAKVSAVDYAVISGKILNTTAKQLTLNNREQKINKTTTIGEDGVFRDTLRDFQEGEFIFYDGKNYNVFYVRPGDDINISYDAGDFKKSLKYSGKGSEISNYLSSKAAKMSELMGRGPDVYKLDEAAFKTKAGEIKAAILALLKEAKDLPADYIARQEKEINYQYLNDIGKYEKYHAYYAKKPDFKVSEDYTDELKNLDYNNEKDYFSSNSYKELVMMHYGKLANELAKTEGISNDIAFLKTAVKIPNEKIKNDLLDNEMGSLKYSDDMKAFYDLFMATSTSEASKKKITETYNKLKVVAAGQPSPKFTNYENYKGGTTSLDDLKGKYVYVDVWATWCGPCKYEIPYLIELDKKYKGKNVTFLSISIDKASDHDKWKKMIAEKGMGGVQLFADNDWKSKFVQDYLINGIPHFILIDPEGKIVKYSAPRPSDKKLIELFDKLGI